MENKLNIKLDTKLLGEVLDTIDAIMGDIEQEMKIGRDVVVYNRLYNIYLELNKLISDYKKVEEK